MWARLSHALKPRQAHEESATASHADVMSNVYEQHPNLSVFHNSMDPQPSPPPSPSKSGRLGMFKRHTKNQDESMRASSPMKKLPSLPKKVRNTFGIHGNASQLSVGPSARGSTELSRVESHDLLSPPAPQGKRRSSLNILRRGSLDPLRSPPTDIDRSPSRAEESRPSEHDQMQEDPATPFEAKAGSVRSILRDRNTPGTGQNVRFFSRDAYKALSPERSTDSEYQSVMTSTPAPPQETFLDRLQRSGSTDSDASSSMPRFGSSSKTSKPRPTVAEIFSPLSSPKQNEAPHSPAAETSNNRLMSQLPPISPPDFTLFDVSQDLELAIPPPPGLGFDIDMSVTDTEMVGAGDSNPMTSTPYREKGKGKEKMFDLANENLAPTVVDESIFHAKEKVSRLPSALHDRSNSFSLGQTAFFSMAHAGSKRASSALGDYPAYPSSAKSSPMSAQDSAPASRASSPGVKGRGRALSDTVFMSMLRSPSPKLPEADINDESSADLIVYSSPKQPTAEPDPFSATANTYYTPQTMIPATPPEVAVGQASKEQDLIISLKTQLALQTELCGQFEADLCARDEMVEVLGKKLESVEREEAKKRSVLKQWKKKVLELERACRFLEEEVETSRHESMERSIMDEASSEALRMLHRQIAGLERDRESWKRLEDVLREEIGTLEARLREKSDDIGKLREMLSNRDESERELKMGISAAKEQMEMMGNLSIGLIDENELKKIVEDREQRHGVVESEWPAEKEELLAALEEAKLKTTELEAEVDQYKQRLDEHDQELAMLKSELEAQWDHTEKATKKLEASQAAKRAAEMECDALKVEVAELEVKVGGLEEELAESENKQIDQDNDIQELWDVKEALEKEREELTGQIHDQDGQVETLKQTLQARDDRIVELEQECKYALDNVCRLEENTRRREAEAMEYSQRILQREAEAETLQEQLSRLKREHASTLEATLAAQTAEAERQARATKDRVADLKTEIERLRRQIHELQQESADKEVKIVQITKQRAQDKEDMQGLNIALDSKQQELELLKRRLGVRGTAGSTPAQPSKIGHQRRDSALFSTPSVGSRPPSVISDAGTDGGSASGTKMPALGKSLRFNTSASKPATAPRATGSMGPPAAPSTKPRASVTGTPTPSSLSRSTSARPVPTSTPAPVAHRRVVSATLDQSTARAMKARQTVNASPAPGEKENVDVNDVKRPSSRARVLVPA
ncbi:hypothetical protein GGX14DRAFT_429090 [Mycena pura]|uniref:Uncharacterized protein n=1 Tax=Mycena pura TaxID=153505 RepID=A0AAD6YL37_9AGAR|nr:hypothetical protein GGX14DRAFT_429090 [Mycena pura]